MTASQIAGLVYVGLALVVVAFEVALALGAPWGEYAMAGANPGRIPPTMRGAVLVQAAILILTAAIVASRAGLVFPSWMLAVRWLIWVVVVILLLSLAANLASPSAGERKIWVPVLLEMLGSSIFVIASTPGLGKRLVCGACVNSLTWLGRFAVLPIALCNGDTGRLFGVVSAATNGDCVVPSNTRY